MLRMSILVLVGVSVTHNTYFYMYNKYWSIYERSVWSTQYKGKGLDWNSLIREIHLNDNTDYDDNQTIHWMTSTLIPLINKLMSCLSTLISHIYLLPVNCISVY